MRRRQFPRIFWRECLRRLLLERGKAKSFLQKNKKMVNVEVQFRTIAMDFWASLEHKLRYKKDIPEDQAQQLQEELLACATQSAQLDERMQEIRNQLVSKFGE